MKRYQLRYHSLLEVRAVDIFILEREKVSSIPFFSSLFFFKEKERTKNPTPNY